MLLINTDFSTLKVPEFALIAPPHLTKPFALLLINFELDTTKFPLALVTTPLNEALLFTIQNY